MDWEKDKEIIFSEVEKAASERSEDGTFKIEVEVGEKVYTIEMSVDFEYVESKGDYWTLMRYLRAQQCIHH